MENVIIIPGLTYSRRRFRKMTDELESSFNTYFFSPNYSEKMGKIVGDLKQYIKDNKIEKSHFITHSFGSLVFRKFLIEPNCEIGKLVELAPIGNGSRMLEHAINLPYSYLYTHGVCHDPEIHTFQKSTKLPNERYVIAGTRRFYGIWPSYLLARLILDNKGSDGLVFREEALSEPFSDFREIDDVHHRLPSNREVIGLIKTYLQRPSIS